MPPKTNTAYRFFAAFFFAFGGLPRFFGAGGVFSIALRASSTVPVMGGMVVSERVALVGFRGNGGLLLYHDPFGILKLSHCLHEYLDDTLEMVV